MPRKSGPKSYPRKAPLRKMLFPPKKKEGKK